MCFVKNSRPSKMSSKKLLSWVYLLWTFPRVDRIWWNRYNGNTVRKRRRGRENAVRAEHRRRTDEWNPGRNWAEGTENNWTTGALGLVSEQSHMQASVCASSHGSWSVPGRALQQRQCTHHHTRRFSGWSHWAINTWKLLLFFKM